MFLQRPASPLISDYFDPNKALPPTPRPVSPQLQAAAETIAELRNTISTLQTDKTSLQKQVTDATTDAALQIQVLQEQIERQQAQIAVEQNEKRRLEQIIEGYKQTDSSPLYVVVVIVALALLYFFTKKN